MADLFRENGYRTAITGKWHLVTGEKIFAPFRAQRRRSTIHCSMR